MLQRSRQPAGTLPVRRPGSWTTAIPQAPRAMVQSGATVSEPLLERIRQSETTKLYPCLVLFGALTAFKDKRKSRQASGDPVCESRRDFLDSFAYLCDTRKGGGTVTAAALQELQNSNFLWLAANDGISDDLLDYAKTMINRLRSINAENQSAVKDDLFKLAMDKCTDRIQFYKDRVQILARNCRMKLRAWEQDETVTSLRKKLRKLQIPSTLSTETYIDCCYEMRAEDIGQIKNFSTGTDDFSDLAHYVWRLGATRSHANIVVDAMLTVPSLQRISEIRRVNAPSVVVKSLDSSCVSPYEILHGIIVDCAIRNPLHNQTALRRLLELDPPVTRQLYNNVAASQTVKTRVHAELQIADVFSRSRDMDFVDNDKYIGCSKPACYFCFNWLYYHHHDYVQPATHHKVITRCRGPDDSLNENGAGVLLDMYTKITKRIGQDVVDFLNKDCNDDGRPRRQYMSTEASSRDESLVSVVRS